MAGWAVGPCTYHGDGALWHVTVVDLRPRGRYAKRETIEATEIEALGALVALLSRPDSEAGDKGSATL